MRTTVNLAVLGLVIERPSYGYELSGRLSERFGELLPVSRSHVYGALDALQRGGLIEPLPPSVSEEAPRQPKIHYRATAEGERAFGGWIAQELDEHARRAELIGAVARLDGSDADAVETLVSAYAQAWARYAPQIADAPH